MPPTRRHNAMHVAHMK